MHGDQRRCGERRQSSTRPSRTSTAATIRAGPSPVIRGSQHSGGTGHPTSRAGLGRARPTVSRPGARARSGRSTTISPSSSATAAHTIGFVNDSDCARDPR